MRLKDIIVADAECCETPEEPRRGGLGRSCDYCPSEAKNQAWDRYVCDQHYNTAMKDHDEKEARKRRARIASQEVNEQPDITDEDEDDEELSANLPEVEASDNEVEGVIRKENGKYCVRSPSNPDWNGGCYSSKGEAEKRLKQVEFFKHKGGFFHEGEFFLADEQGVHWFDTREGAFKPWRFWKDAGVTGVQKNLGANHPKRAAGILFVCQGRVLLVRRAYDETNPEVWSIPGGHVKLAHDGMPQDVWGNAKREVVEEMGGLPPGIGRATRKHRALSKSGNVYTTYIVELPPGAMKWRPRLNPEHSAYRWCNRKQVKALKLHPNVARVLKNQDIWDGKFFTTVRINLERDAQIGQIMQEGKQQIDMINAAAEEVFGQMAKDFRFVRLELTTVIHGPPGYIPVAGVDGVMRKGSAEVFFTLSVSPKNGSFRALLKTKKIGYKVSALFRTPTGIMRWAANKLAALDV
jgi:8-oxo-dGTP pyrophosphatase MutT (NUDIX family)